MELSILIIKRTDLQSSLKDIQERDDAQSFFSQIMKDLQGQIELLDKQIKNFKKALPKDPSIRPVPVEPRQYPKASKTLSNSHRTIFRQEVVEDLQTARNQLKHIVDTIYRLQNEKQAFSTQVLVSRARDKQTMLKGTIEQLEQKIQDIDEGRHDEEFQSILETNRTEATKKQKATAIRKKKKTPEARPAYSQQPYKREYGMNTRDISYEFNRYMNSWIPNNLVEKLNHMENNRGFLWNGSSYYGKLPCTRSPEICILSERKNLGAGRFEILNHEYGPSYYKVYTEYRGRRTIIHEEQRKRIPCNLPTLDF